MLRQRAFRNHDRALRAGKQGQSAGARQHDRSAEARPLPPVVTRRRGSAFHLRPAEVLQLQRSVGNRAVRQWLQREEIQRPAPREVHTLESGVRDDLSGIDDAALAKLILEYSGGRPVTGYVGFNPDAAKEAQTLKRATRGRLIVSLDNPQAEKGLHTPVQRANSVVHDLQIQPTEPRFRLVVRCLAECHPQFREQMADLMRMFHHAEIGRHQLVRLVMSGHSNGLRLWGEAERGRSAGSILLERDLTNLVRAFPVAAAQVQHIMFSACYSVAAVQLATKLFPNLRSAWGYAGFSPSIRQGSARHIRRWERRTRGKRTPGRRDRMAKSAIWVRGKDFVVGGPQSTPADRLRAEWGAAVARVRRQVLGTEPLDGRFLRRVYGILQHMVVQPDLTPHARRVFDQRRDTILRLRFFGKVCGHFSRTYRLEVQMMYRAAGLPQPSIADLTRAQLRTEIDRLSRALKGQQAAAARRFLADKVVGGLWRLSPEVIPVEWV